MQDPRELRSFRRREREREREKDETEAIERLQSANGWSALDDPPSSSATTTRTSEPLMTMMRCEEMPRQLPRPGSPSLSFPFLSFRPLPPPTSNFQRPFPLFSSATHALLRNSLFPISGVLCPRFWSLSPYSTALFTVTAATTKAKAKAEIRGRDRRSILPIACHEKKSEAVERGQEDFRGVETLARLAGRRAALSRN